MIEKMKHLKRKFLCIIGAHVKVHWTRERCENERVFRDIFTPWECKYCDYKSKKFFVPPMPKMYPPKSNDNDFKEQLERKVIGALRSTISAHGAITKELISSASKRIVGELLSNDGVNSSKEFTEVEQFAAGRNQFFQWIADCAKLLIRDGKVLIEDNNWYRCYGDGMTPEEAVAEYKTYCPENS